MTEQEVMEQALDAMRKIHQGCGHVKSADDVHKDAKSLATYVRKDCVPAMKSLEQAIEFYASKKKA